MSLTLSQARQKLYRYVSPTLDAPLVTDKINSALERIYHSGKWKGLMTSVYFSQIDDPEVWWTQLVPKTITLPRRFLSVLGVKFDHAPRLTYPRWQEYTAGGAGTILAGTGMQKIIDAGDGFLTYADPSAYYYPRFEITDPQDVGKEVHFSGIDGLGNTLYDSTGNAGFKVTLTLDGVTFSNIGIARITSIRKPLTEGSLNLFAVNPNDQTQKAQIASYEPTETVPSYKRYRLASADFSRSIDCLCKRRFIPLVNGPDDNTVIVPGNEGALKNMLMSLQYEDQNDMERAELYFKKSLQLLNQELKEDMGAPIVTLQMNPIATAMKIPSRY